MSLLAAPPDAADNGDVDLHMHSTASDGTATPAVVVETALAAGLSAIALTDHDTLDGLPAARAAAAGTSLRVITGAELSAMDGEEEIHLLGLHLAHPEVVERELVRFRDARQVRAHQIVVRLNSLGVPVTMPSVLSAADGGAVGRPHVARALIAGGWVRDLREAFDRYLGAGRPAFVAKQRLEIAAAIALVHAAGGLAIYAHPGNAATRARLEALAADGLDGVEVRHPSHSAEDAARIAALVDHLGLVPSGGSDWHGAKEGHRVMGGMKVPHLWLLRQEARVAERAARDKVA